VEDRGENTRAYREAVDFWVVKIECDDKEDVD
jgi:hypothetical protein